MKYFYYDHLGNIYLSKFEALRKTNTPSLYFYDKEFLAANWSVEPSVSLQQLYKNRAHQIRDKYKYVILAYSGGIDSTTILETFYYNNIHIDEIVVVGALSQDDYKGSDANHNGELYHNVFPTLNNLNLAKTKITVVDYTKQFNKLPLLNNLELKYKILDEWFSPHHWWWATLENTFEYPNSCIVFGIDKPNYNTDESGRGYFEFTSSLINQYGHSAFEKSSSLTREFFYWSPDMPEILIKQLHVVDRFYRLCVQMGKLNKQSFLENHNQIVSKLVYPEPINKLRFLSPKSPSSILSLRDQYLVKTKNSDIYKDYVKYLEWLKANKLATLNGHSPINPYITSRRYYLK